jgi:hypothetical protein
MSHGFKKRYVFVVVILNIAIAAAAVFSMECMSRAFQTLDDKDWDGSLTAIIGNKS